jgi:hypothetical protein
VRLPATIMAPVLSPVMPPIALKHNKKPAAKNPLVKSSTFCTSWVQAKDSPTAY